MSHDAASTAQLVELPSIHRAQRRRLARIFGSLVGLALIGLATWVVLRDRATIEAAFAAIKHASAWLIVCLLTMPVLSWSLTSMMYCSLTNRDRDVIRRRHVGFLEMHSVLGSAWLLNYLPARPGMVGRLMYHTLVNRMPFPSVFKASLLAMVCGVVATGMLVAAAVLLVLTTPVFAADSSTEQSTVAVIWVLASPALGLAIASWLARHREGARRVLLALLARYIDVLTWLVRYVCIFAMLGRPVSLLEAAAFTAASQAANMVPLVGNGMGLREWASALLAPALPRAGVAGMAGAAGLTQALTLSAELIHRAAELLVALPIGLVSLAVVSKRVAAARAANKVRGA
jgi:hypothetical protein